MLVSRVSLLLLSIVLVVDATRVATSDHASSKVGTAGKNDMTNIEHISEGIHEENIENISTTGTRGICVISGDPHIRPFDGGHYMHPMHAPGHWWLVHGRDDFMSIQATYGGCGLKHGGWMSARLGDVPRTCLTGMAIGGDLMKSANDFQNLLVVRPACECDWDNSRCTNQGHTTTRITWNGDAVSSLDVADPPVRLTMAGDYIEVHLNRGVVIKLWTAGRWGGNPNQYMNAHIEMDKPPAGSVCGHCGNFNGNAADDHMYEYSGMLKASITDPMCDASVHCDDRLMHGIQFGSYTAKESYECEENKEGVAFKIEDCPKDVLKHAREECINFFSALEQRKVMKFLPPDEQHTRFNECLMDECIGEGFAKDDADDTVHEAEDFAKDLK